MRALDIALLAGRLLFGGFFVVSGLNHFTSRNELTGFAASQGVPLPELAVVGTGVLLLAGGASVLLGAWPRAGLALLVVFLVGVTPTMHAFWAIEDPVARAAQMGSFLKNLGLLGAALAMMALPTPWALSTGPTLGAARERRRTRRAS